MLRRFSRNARENDTGAAMAKSELVRDMDKIIRAVKPELRAAGFEWRGRDFTRRTADGLTQAINFQASQSGGKFTVNLGVFVPEVRDRYRRGEALPNPARIQECDCQIRTRLQMNGRDRVDPWWPAGDWEAAAADIAGRLRSYGLPFLNRYATRELILRHLPGDKGPAVPPAGIILAMICFERGEYSRARDLLVEHVRRPDSRPHHVRHVLEVAEWLGLDMGAVERSAGDV